MGTVTPLGVHAVRGALRAAVPGPTGRTAQRSAFPCLHPVKANRAAPSEQQLMAANLRFAAREIGGKV